MRRSGEGRDPYSVTDLVGETRDSNLAQQVALVVMGPLRNCAPGRNDTEFVAQSVRHTSALIDR
ncbi:hypothetical protein ABTM93_19755, partial [Acinetobacter baumannii]